MVSQSLKRTDLGKECPAAAIFAALRQKLPSLSVPERQEKRAFSRSTAKNLLKKPLTTFRHRACDVEAWGKKPLEHKARC
jgi:hypothetical protein